MILKKNQIFKIATILPYKENYSTDKASAASLWVSEFFKNSKFKKKIFIYGHTKSNNFLTKNYINIDLKNIKSKFKSTTNEYSEKLIEALKRLRELKRRLFISKMITVRTRSRGGPRALRSMALRSSPRARLSPVKKT